MWWHVFYQCFRMTPGTETADNPLDHGLAVAGVEDMMLRYRNHPSIISWIGANEVLMNESLYKLTKEKVRSIDTTRVYLPTTSFHWDVDALTPYLKEDLPTGTTDDGAPDYNWAPSSYFFDKVREVHLQMFRVPLLQCCPVSSPKPKKKEVYQSHNPNRTIHSAMFGLTIFEYFPMIPSITS